MSLGFGMTARKKEHLLHACYFKVLIFTYLNSFELTYNSYAFYCACINYFPN